jgi:hypothetical protein
MIWMRFLLGAGVAIFLTLSSAQADIVEQGPRNAKPSGLLAGVARVDIRHRSEYRR